MNSLRDMLSLRYLTLSDKRELRVHFHRAQRLFDGMLADDPNGLALAERPLAELPASDRLAEASSQEVLSIAIASAGHLRRITLKDTARSVALKPPRAYWVHFAAIRILEVAADIQLPFTLSETKLFASIALNASKFEERGDITIQRGSEWPDFAAQLITSRIIAPERLDLFGAAVSAAETLDGGLYDGVLASRVVRMGQRLARVEKPMYEVGEMHARINRVLAKPTSLLHLPHL